MVYVCSECGKYSRTEKECCEGATLITSDQLGLDEKEVRYSKVAVRKKLAELYLKPAEVKEKKVEITKPCDRCAVLEEERDIYRRKLKAERKRNRK